MVTEALWMKDTSSVFASASPKPLYAGAAFSTSPPPSSLPLPSFYKKKKIQVLTVVDDSATRDLRRLLRLD